MAKTGRARNPLIFISHMSQEAELAEAVKRLIEEYFVHMDVYVSSVKNEKDLGRNFLNEIEDRLKHCVAVIVLCSPKSVERPWVQFEAGAGWIRGVPVIAVCHSGMDPEQLPWTLRHLESVRASSLKDLESLMHNIAKLSTARMPKVDFTEFVKKVEQIESEFAPSHEILQVYERSRDVQLDLGKRIAHAKQEIWLCGTQFAVSLSDWRPDYTNALLRGVKITAVVIDPDSNAVELTAKSYDMDVDELRAECRDCIGKLKGLRREREDLAKATPGRVGEVDIRLTRVLPRARYYAFDPAMASGVLLYTPYVEQLRSSQSPTYAFRTATPVAEVYIDACRKTINGSEPMP